MYMLLGLAPAAEDDCQAWHTKLHQMVSPCAGAQVGHLDADHLAGATTKGLGTEFAGLDMVEFLPKWLDIVKKVCDYPTP